MKKRILSILLVLAMVLSLIPTMSFAASAEEAITFTDQIWNGEKFVPTEKECKNYVLVDADTKDFEDGKWYVINSDLIVNSRITVSGKANLILVDSFRFDAARGIEVSEGNRLDIYGQSNNSGILCASGYRKTSAIGGSENCNGGTINIFGGTVEAYGVLGGADADKACRISFAADNAVQNKRSD